MEVIQEVPHRVRAKIHFGLTSGFGYNEKLEVNNFAWIHGLKMKDCILL